MDDVMEKARAVKALILDVDGVLTDGTLWFGPDGEVMKAFNILDGLGIKLLQSTGVQVGIITGRHSETIASRAAELGLEHLLQGREDKREALEELLATLGLAADACAYMGDDLPDLAAIRHAHLGITVPNGHPFVIRHADWCTERSGGRGAVREACDLILQARGDLTTLCNGYL